MHPKTASAIRLLLSSCAFAAWLAMASPPLGADDFIIDDDETQQNGGVTINGDDTLTITETGSITYSGTDQNALLVTGNNNELDIYGSIIVTGSEMRGIRFNNGSNNVLTNYGLISVTGHNPTAVHWNMHGSDNIFINRGRLEAHGYDGAAFYASWGVNSQQVL